MDKLPLVDRMMMDLDRIILRDDDHIMIMMMIIMISGPIVL